MVKVNITLSRLPEHNGTLQPIQVVVAAHFVQGVYAVHKLDRNFQQWELVHVPTGLRIGVHETLRDAKRCVAELPQLGQRCTFDDTRGFGPGELYTLQLAYQKLTAEK